MHIPTCPYQAEESRNSKLKKIESSRACTMGKSIENLRQNTKGNESKSTLSTNLQEIEKKKEVIIPSNSIKLENHEVHQAGSPYT